MCGAGGEGTGQDRVRKTHHLCVLWVCRFGGREERLERDEACPEGVDAVGVGGAGVSAGQGREEGGAHGDQALPRMSRQMKPDADEMSVGRRAWQGR